jgi:hypothetical protein
VPIDVPTFLAGFPEFVDAPVSLINAKLAEAKTHVQGPVWAGGGPSRDFTQQATFLYAAHFLALSPYARSMALVKTDGSTLYSQRIADIKRAVTSGFRVL